MHRRGLLCYAEDFGVIKKAMAGRLGVGVRPLNFMAILPADCANLSIKTIWKTGVKCPGVGKPRASGWWSAGWRRVWCAGAAAGAWAVAHATDFREAERAGHLPADVTEASGLAASRREPGLFWVHADSGGEPILRAVAADGSPRGILRIDGAGNVDWEDAASFTLDGRAWLLVADTGDNASRRATAPCSSCPSPIRRSWRRTGS